MWLSLWAIVIPSDGLLAGLAYVLVPLHGAFGLAQAHVVASLVRALTVLLVLTVKKRRGLALGKQPA
jgi:hypothetical protein